MIYDIDFRSAEMKDSVFYNTIFVKSRLIMVESECANFEKAKFDNSMLMHGPLAASATALMLRRKNS